MRFASNTFVRAKWKLRVCLLEKGCCLFRKPRQWWTSSPPVPFAATPESLRRKLCRSSRNKKSHGFIYKEAVQKALKQVKAQQGPLVVLSSSGKGCSTPTPRRVLGTAPSQGSCCLRGLQSSRNVTDTYRKVLLGFPALLELSLPLNPA